MIETLKERSGDDRKLLLKLYDHANLQVHLNAANATFPIAREAARAQLEAIASSQRFPQAGAAGMAIRALDAGISTLLQES